jgi:hypothetical protein
MKTETKVKTAITLTAVLYIGAIIVNLIILGLVGWVAWHFISKLW